MNIAARPSPADQMPPDRAARSGNARFRIALFDDLAASEPVWRQLEDARPFITPYQRFEWISHWFNHVGRAEGDAPLVVAGFDASDAPLFILPFIRMRRHSCNVAGFCGGSHSNLNMPIFRAEAATTMEVDGLLAEIAGARGIDLFALRGQPQVWLGVPNPFAILPRQPSPDDVYTGILDPATEFTPRLPSGMRKKARKLTKLDGFRYAMARTPDESDRILQAFRVQKAARFARQGIRNVFEDPGVMEFIRAACLDGLAEGHPVIELHALAGAGEVLAVVGGVSNAQRFSVMFNSITSTIQAKFSPGIILMSDIVAACAQRGITSFDLGAGHAAYKTYFCSSSEQRFDCFVPFSGRGQLLSAAWRTSDALRRSLKTNPALMSAIGAVRRWTTTASIE